MSHKHCLPVYRFIVFCILFAMFLFFLPSPDVAYAKQKNLIVNGTLYSFDVKSNYELYEGSEEKDISLFQGSLSISGAIKANGKKSEIDSYIANEGDITFSYSIKDGVQDQSNGKWYVVKDGGKIVDEYKLNGSIKSGALIVQSSMDGEKWITEAVFTDIVVNQDNLKQLYTTKDIQLINGCYYKVIAVYKLECIIGTSTNIFGKKVDEKETKKVMETYELYASYKDSSDGAITPKSTPFTILGEKNKTKKDGGFSEIQSIDKDDPHFGKDIGHFVMNGYTRKTEETREVPEKGWPVFLKTVGDKITLWFVPEDDFDIDKLFGNDKLSIAEDKNGYDQHFGIFPSNFKHGALIIRYTDYQGVVHDPIVYTDFLAANVRTGADTKVQLFEEGNYEVSLDYEIKEGLSKYTNYKISFNFEIRNSNCMAFPFDVTTGNELSNGDRSENGFRLDMAKSRYLTIDVAHYSIKESGGLLSLDERFNRPAADDDSYTDPGVYIFTVRNLYTGEKTEKTIFVGTDKYIRALSLNKITVDDLNALLSAGSVVQDDGSIVTDQGQEIEPEPTMEVEQQQPEVIEPGDEPEESSEEKPNNSETDGEESIQPSDENDINTEHESNVSDDNQIGSINPIAYAAGTVAVIGAGGLFALRRKKRK